VALFRYDESGHRSQYVDADARLDPEGEEIWLFFFSAERCETRTRCPAPGLALWENGREVAGAEE